MVSRVGGTTTTTATDALFDALPLPVHGATSVMQRLARLRCRGAFAPQPPTAAAAAACAAAHHVAPPLPPPPPPPLSHLACSRGSVSSRRRTVPARRAVSIRQGGGGGTGDGDEVTSVSQWNKDAAQSLSQVSDDVLRLDAMLRGGGSGGGDEGGVGGSVGAQQQLARRGELLLAASSRHAGLRASLEEPATTAAAAAAAGEGEGSGGRGRPAQHAAYVDEQLRKLAALHPQGYLGVLHRVAQTALARCLLDVEGQELLQRIERQARKCVGGSKGPTLPCDEAWGGGGGGAGGGGDGGDDHDDDERWDHGEVVRANAALNLPPPETTDAGVQCTLEGDERRMAEEEAAAAAAAAAATSSAPSLSSASSALPCITARTCLLSLHAAAAAAAELAERFLLVEGCQALSGDSVVVSWAHACRDELATVGGATLRSSAAGAVADLAAAALKQGGGSGGGGGAGAAAAGTAAAVATEPNHVLVASTLGHLTRIVSQMVETVGEERAML